MSKFGLQKMCYENLSAELKKVRLEQNLSTAEVALKSYLPLNLIERIENGDKISFHKYNLLAKFYNKKIKLVLE